MPVIACMQREPRALARVAEVLSADHLLFTTPSWSRLREILGRHRVDGCILDLLDGEQALLELRRLRRHHPWLAILVYTDFQGREIDLFHLGRLGVDAVLICGRGDDPQGIRRSVDLALASSLASWVVGHLEGEMDSVGLACLRWAVENARGAPDVGGLAKSLSLTPRSLNRRLRSRGLPTPSRLLLWGRLFRAGRLLEGGSETVEQVAYHLGYSSAAALRRPLGQHVGCSPTELAARGGAAFVLEAFLAAEFRRRPGARRLWALQRPAAAHPVAALALL